MLIVGRPIIESIAEVGGAGSKVALLALGRIDRGALGQAACRLADGLTESTPRWLADVGTAPVVGAFSAYSPGDGEVIMLDVDCLACAHMVVVFVDARLGGLAKHIRVLRRIDPLSVDESDGAGFRFRASDRDLACGRVRNAIELSESAPGAPIDASFSQNRALAIARLAPRATAV
jgi:hypothetical protein